MGLFAPFFFFGVERYISLLILFYRFISLISPHVSLFCFVFFSSFGFCILDLSSDAPIPSKSIFSPIITHVLGRKAE